MNAYPSRIGIKSDETENVHIGQQGQSLMGTAQMWKTTATVIKFVFVFSPGETLDSCQYLKTGDGRSSLPEPFKLKG